MKSKVSGGVGVHRWRTRRTDRWTNGHPLTSAPLLKGQLTQNKVKFIFQSHVCHPEVSVEVPGEHDKDVLNLLIN